MFRQGAQCICDVAGVVLRRLAPPQGSTVAGVVFCQLAVKEGITSPLPVLCRVNSH